MLQFTENRQRNIGLSASSNPRTVLNSVGLLEATQAEAIAGTVQNRYISPLRLAQVVANEATGDLTKTDDTNVTLTLGGTPTDALFNDVSLTLGWTGTLAAARLNSSVVQGVTNDTNVTGSISAQVLTLGWTGTLAASRGGTGLSALGSGVATWLGTPSSANLLAAITDETGTGALVFAGSPTFTTQITAPKIIGGTAAGDDLTFQTTTGNGSGDEFIWLRGNNGATEAMRLGVSALTLGDAISTLTLGDNGGSQAVIATDGASTNASINIRPKGTGSVQLQNDSIGTIAAFTNAAGATATTNYINFNNSASGAALNLATGGSANIAIAFRTKGTGSFFIQTDAAGEMFTVTSTGALSAPGAETILNATAIPAGGTAGAGYKFSSTSNFGVFFGSGAPSLSAAQGSLYLRSDGSSTSTRAYINTNGSTTWTAITTAA